MSIEWGLLMIFTFLFVFQLFAVVWVASTYADYRNPAFYTYGFSTAAAYLILTVIVVCFIRGGFRRGAREGHPLPPWLLAV
jgi:hypothetical protein